MNAAYPAMDLRPSGLSKFSRAANSIALPGDVLSVGFQTYDLGVEAEFCYVRLKSCSCLTCSTEGPCCRCFSHQHLGAMLTLGVDEGIPHLKTAYMQHHIVVVGSCDALSGRYPSFAPPTSFGGGCRSCINVLGGDLAASPDSKLAS